ncbi:PAS domain-containing protein [Synechococcus elongatus IITB7]|uniref:sensor domain-containing diguanylate cyclase n=1 Tax=Synechococcus elongatus TaxID=32046 RepID=UPI0030CE5518
MTAGGQWQQINVRFKPFKNRRLLGLLASQVVVFWLDLQLPPAISLLAYYWVPVVLSVLFATPIQVLLLAGVALSFTIAVGLYWGDLFSAGYLVRMIGGAVIAAIAVYLAVQRQRETAARFQLEERYRLLAENASDVVLFAQADHRIHWASPSLPLVLGWNPEDWIGTRLSVFIHRQDAPALEALYAQLADLANRVSRHEKNLRLRHHDGDYRWFAIRITAVYDTTGRLSGYVKGLRDIQDQVRSQQALAAERAQLRATLDSLIDPHVLLTAIRDEQGNIIDFRYIDANPAACLYNRTSRDNLIGKTLLQILPAHQASGLLDQYIQAMTRPEPLILNDYAYSHDIYLEERRFDIRAVRIDESLSYTWRDVTDRYQAAQQLAEAKERYQQLAQRWEFAMDFGDLAIYESNYRTQKVFYSPGILKQLGYQPGDWSESLNEWLQRLHPEDRIWIEQDLQSARADRNQSIYTIEYRIQHRDGSYRWIIDRGKVLAYDDENRPLRSIGTHIDITESKQAEEALSRANQKMRMASLAAGIGFWELDWVTEHCSWDAQMWKLYGLEPGALEEIYPSWWQFVYPDDRDQMQQLMAGIQVQTTTNFFEHDFRIIRANDQQVRHIYSSIYVTRDPQDQVLRLSGVNLDITNQKRAEQELTQQAQTDELTGLFNRRAAIAKIQSLCELDRRHGEANAVLFCDLDHFKNINDYYGHAAGDAVLKVTAERIQSAIRSNDFAARIGGDELLVVLRGVQSLENAVAIAEKLRHLVAEPVPTDAGLVDLTLTIGVTLIQSEETIDTLIARADTAMYQGKQAGRDRVISFTCPLNTPDH